MGWLPGVGAEIQEIIQYEVLIEGSIPRGPMVKYHVVLYVIHICIGSMIIHMRMS